jgi:transposase
MPRKILRDDQWERIEAMLPGKATDRGRTAADNRLFVEAVLWIARTGSPWRDLPKAFGPWNSVHKRFARWSDSGLWHRVFEELAKDADFDEVFLDSTIVRAHQHAAGAPKKRRSGARALAGRTEHQDSCAGRGSGLSGPLEPERWSSARCDAGRSDTRWHCHADHRCRQSLRCRVADRSDYATRRLCGDSSARESQGTACFRYPSLQTSESDRTFLLSPQTVSPNCYSLRQARQPLFIVYRAGSGFPMVGLNVNRP